MLVLLIALAFGLPFALSQLLSWHPALGPYRTSILNPMLFISAFIVVGFLDFASVEAIGYGKLIGHTISYGSWPLLWLALKFAAMLLSLLLGMAAVFFGLGPRKPPPLRRRPTRIAPIVLILYSATLLGWAAIFSKYLEGHWTLAQAAYAKAAASADVSAFTLALLITPGLCFCLPRRSLKVVLPIMVSSIAVLVFSGSRLRVLFVIVPFVFYLVRVRGIQIPRLFFGIGIFIAGFLAIAAVSYRHAVTSDAKHFEIAGLAQPSELLNQDDIAFAEANIALSRIRSRTSLTAYPGQDLLGFVLADIPRSIVPFKPVPGSVAFTKVYDPFGYARYGRGLTIGGINEIEFFYPYPAALVVIFALGVAWAAAFRWAATARTVHGFVWCVGLYLVLFSFQKGDLQQAGQQISAFLIYSVLVKLIELLDRRRPVAAARDLSNEPSHAETSLARS